MERARVRGFQSPPDPALLAREIELCGWRPEAEGQVEIDAGGAAATDAADVATAEPISIQSPRGAYAVPIRMFDSVADTAHPARLALVDLRGGALTPPGELFTRFLDFPMEVRLVLAALRRRDGIRFAVVARRELIQFFRLPGEAIERQVEDERGVEDELLPALTAHARSRADRHMGANNPLETAEALRGWVKDWGRRIGSQLGAPDSAAEQFVWKIALMLQVDRKIHGREAAADWGMSAERAGGGLTLAYDAMSAHADLERVLGRFEETFSSRIFSGDLEESRQWLYELDETPLIERLRSELLMQAQARFEPDSVAWLFTHMDRETEGWRREMAGAPPTHKRLAARGWSVIEPLVADVGRYGLASALRDMERVADHWDDYDAYRRAEAERGGAGVDQPDLFAGAPRGVDRTGAMTDPVNFILSESIRFAGVPAGEEFGVGLAILLKAIDLAAARRWPFHGVDSLDLAWKP